MMAAIPPADAAVPGRWSDKAPLADDARQFFVAPDGRADGAGTAASPWDLATAFSSRAPVRPGDVVWLRGGVYGAGAGTVFTCKLKGSEQRPIVVRQYPSERATVNGGIEAPAECSWVWFWGFEVTNTSPVRRCLCKDRPPGVNLHGRGIKTINLAIHDAGHPGVGFWVSVGDGGEISGCLMWGNGLYDMGDKRFPNGWTRGSPIYAQNKDGTRYITDVIAFRNFTTGMKAYTEGGYANGFHFEGNITFDSPDWNLFGSGKKNPMERLALISNCTYRRPDDGVRQSVQFGYYGAQNLDAVVKDNYFVLRRGGDRAFCLKHWRDLVCTGNTLVGLDAIVNWIPGEPAGKVTWDNNTYHSAAPKSFMFNKAVNDFATWKQATGFDAHSMFAAGAPTGLKVFVRANKYEPGRGNVVVYNWDRDSTVDVDVSAILKPGDKYEVRDAQNFFGKSVAAGTYDGRPITLPMNLTEVAALVGDVKHLKYGGHTAPEFAAFVVLTDAPPPGPLPPFTGNAPAAAVEKMPAAPAAPAREEKPAAAASNVRSTDPPAQRGRDDQPPVARGVTAGRVARKGGNWIEITSDSGKTTRYIPEWHGGGPGQGGGPDGNTLRRIAALNVGDRAVVEWYVNDHVRIKSLGPAK